MPVRRNEARDAKEPGTRPAPVVAPCPKTDQSERALLVNPAIYDVRFNWPQWQTPTRLFQLAAHLESLGTSVKMLDALCLPSLSKFPKKLVGYVVHDNVKIQKWRFGFEKGALAKALQGLKDTSWIPDIVFVDGFTTFWWEGVREAADLCRANFPHATIRVTGAYAELCPEHVEQVCHAEATIFDLKNEPKLSVEGRPVPTHLHLAVPKRYSRLEPMECLIERARKAGVKEFAFHFDLKTRTNRLVALEFLEDLANLRSKLKFDVLGGLKARDVLDVPEIAAALRAAGMKHCVFADDRDRELSRHSDDEFIGECTDAVWHFHRAGYRPRTDSVSASLSLGRKGESLEERTRVAALLSHHVGSVIIWPYQPLPGELPGLALEELNGKLFPHRQANGLGYTDYTELVALAAVLNAKYRDCSFDFLGGGLISRLLQDSIRREAWNPPDEVKGPLTLPMKA